MRGKKKMRAFWLFVVYLWMCAVYLLYAVGFGAVRWDLGDNDDLKWIILLVWLWQVDIVRCIAIHLKSATTTTSVFVLCQSRQSKAKWYITYTHITIKSIRTFISFSLRKTTEKPLPNSMEMHTYVRFGASELHWIVLCFCYYCCSRNSFFSHSGDAIVFVDACLLFCMCAIIFFSGYCFGCCCLLLFRQHLFSLLYSVI